MVRCTEPALLEIYIRINYFTACFSTALFCMLKIYQHRTTTIPSHRLPSCTGVINIESFLCLVKIHYTGLNPIGGLIAGIKAHVPVYSVGSRVIGGDGKGVPVSLVIRLLGQGSGVESKGKDKNQDNLLHFTPLLCFMLLL
jgi:hypothetical protein